MVTLITQKEFKQIQKTRKNRPGQLTGFLVWQAPDGRYYKNDQSGIAGTKELVDWNKKIQSEMESQTSLI